MLYNVAHFMLPGRSRTQHKGLRNRLHDVADGALRLLALAATLQMIVASLGALLDTVALQVGHTPDRLPTAFRWLDWISDGVRGSAALTGVLLVVLLLGLISTKTAKSYEARDPTIEKSTGEQKPAVEDEPLGWPMAEPAFWQGKNLVDRQWTAHLAAALGAVAVVGALPGLPGLWHWCCVVLGGVIVAGAVLATASDWLNRYYVAHQEAKDRRDPERESTDSPRRRRLVVVVAAAVAILTIGVTALDGTWTRTASMTAELDTVWFWLGVAQLLLIVVLVLAVGALLVTKRRDSGDLPGPYLNGFLGPVVVTLAVVLGGLLSAVVAIAAARPFGDPIPSGSDPATGIVVPGLLYAYAAAPLGLLIGAIVLIVPLRLWFARRRRNHLEHVPDEYGEPAATPPYGSDSRRTAGAWAVGDLADVAGVALATVTAGGAAVVLLSAQVIAVTGILKSFVEWAASIGAVVALAIAAWLVALLRGAYASSAKRRGIGVVWDVGTFWPRAAHPLAPPCYAERAVPEVVDRISVLTGERPADTEKVLTGTGAAATAPAGLVVPVGPVLLTGYSQGSIIAPAVVAQLPATVREKVALLTLACPARRLYGRAFPAFFGTEHLTTLASDLRDQELRWKNAFRRSDFIGSWIERDDPTGTADELDVVCHDPVALVPDSRPTPSPIHRHSAWWPDPQVGAIAEDLVTLLYAHSATQSLPGQEVPQTQENEVEHGRQPHSARFS
jgi:hypothetical protein